MHRYRLFNNRLPTTGSGHVRRSPFKCFCRLFSSLQHAGLEELTSLQGLTELNLNHVPNIKGLSDLLNLTQLECLHIGYSNVDRQMLHELSTNMPQLLSLDVSYSMYDLCTPFEDTDSEDFGSSLLHQDWGSNYTVGHLCSSQESDSFAELSCRALVLLELIHLRIYSHLEIQDDCRGITHTGARDTFRYKNRAGGLTELILDGYADMRNLAPLELLSSFQSFSMKDCGGQDAWLESLSFLTGLTRLNISSNQDLTDEGMCFVARQASLRVLAIQDLPLLTSRGLRHLSSLTNLEMLKTFPLAGALPEGDLPRKVQQAMDAAAAEIPSLFLADITDDSD